MHPKLYALAMNAHRVPQAGLQSRTQEGSIECRDGLVGVRRAASHLLRSRPDAFAAPEDQATANSMAEIGPVIDMFNILITAINILTTWPRLRLYREPKPIRFAWTGAHLYCPALSVHRESAS